MHFSYDLEGTLTDEERIVNDILAWHKKNDGLKDDNFNIVIHDYFTHFDKMSVFAGRVFMLFCCK
jgi:Mlc titration factor MtfA (ptsG expression regulator)